ncbi:MAG: tyrosine-type recombinase/integrase, partial [Planctomycetia bacterium]
MASLSSEKYELANGKTVTAYRVVIREKKRRPQTIRLGTISKQQAEVTRNRINAIVAAQAIGCAIDADTTAWLARIEDWLYDKLVKAGLVPPRTPAAEARSAVTLGDHLERLFAARPRKKQTTARNELRARRLLESFFGKDKTLESITPGDGDDYRAWLQSNYAPSSASVDLRRAKEFLEAARRRRLIVENPFADLSCGPQTNEDRIEFIPLDTIARVIAACPDLDWKLIFGFARYEGLRIPSELASMRWSDVDWERNRITVYSPKVEHHAGRKYRVVPIFPEMRPYLEQAYREREPGQELVVSRAHGAPNLGTEANRIITRAGIEPWEKTFVNLRGSRSDELERDYPAHVVDAWMGNSSRVRRRHYLKVTDADFERAAGYPVRNPVPSAAVAGHQQPSTLHGA